MTTEQLVTIDFESEPVNSENAQITPIKNILKSNQRNILEDCYSDVIFSDNQEEERNESQPLLGGEHHETQIIYNQFPSKLLSKLKLIKLKKEKLLITVEM